MKCPSCESDKGEILESRLSTDEARVRRRRRCSACGHRWTTIEAELDVATGKVIWAGAAPTGSVRASASRAATPTGSVAKESAHPTGSAGPPSRGSNPPTGSVGGVGGGLPSGSRSAGDPDPSQQTPQDLPRARGRLIPFAPPLRPLAVVGAVTEPFLRCVARYPRKYRRLAAAQTWQAVAAVWPGGEAALEREILAAFDGGMLRRPPYNGPDGTRPAFEKFIADGMWLDTASAPDGAVDRRDPDRMAERTSAALAAKRVPDASLPTKEQLNELRAQRSARGGA